MPYSKYHGHLFGYENCSEYVDDSVKIETELICDGLKKLYGTDTTNQSNINSAFVKFDGSKQSVTGAELPSWGYSGTMLYPD